jgi:hypothetical protein
LGVVGLGLRGSEDDSGYASTVAIQSAQDLKAVEVRHKEVEYEDVWVVLLHHLEGVLAIGR